MSDLLMNVTLARKNIQKKRQMRSKDLSLNFGSLLSIDSDRSKTERNLRLRSQDRSQNSEILVTSPLPPRRFEFQESVHSPTRLHSYKLDATLLLIGRLTRYLNKHFLIWKKRSDYLKSREQDLFQKQGKRLKVNVGRVDRQREVQIPEFAGKIVRQSHDFQGKIVSNAANNVLGLSDDDTPLIGSGLEVRKSKKASNDKIDWVLDQKPKSPRYPSVRSSEKAAKKVQNALGKICRRVIKSVILVIREVNRTEQIKGRIARIQKVNENWNVGFLPEEASSPSICDSDSRRNNKQVFEGCLKNLKDFISDKREKKGKPKKELEDVRMGFEKIERIIRGFLTREGFNLIGEGQDESYQELIQGFEEDELQGSFKETLPERSIEKGLKKMVKNVKKDVQHRIHACFKYWKTVIKSDMHYQEEFSLSAVTIHNILLNIINCRTKVFFSTYKLAMIKYMQQNEERFKNYSKAINRMSLCLREYKLKPFLAWKYSVSESSFSKKYVFRLERAINELLYHNFQFSFASILLFAKFKTLKIRGLSRIFLKCLRSVFKSFQQNIKKSRKFYGSSKTFAVTMKNFQSYFKSAPKKFSFKYLCHSMKRLELNLNFHYNSLKKNTMIKWKLACAHHNKLQSIRKKYDKEVSHALATGSLFNTLNMIYVTILRLSFMKLRKAEYKPFNNKSKAN